MKPVKIGLIGCGKISEVAHVPALLEQNKHARITALYDLKEKAAKEIKKKYSLDCQICKSPEGLLASEVVGVIISTPNHTHYPLTIQALDAGKHVLVEKPMAVDLNQADKMIAMAKRRSLYLQVNQSLRFSPPYVKIKQMIENGDIGKPLHIRCLRAGSCSPDKGWSPGAKWFTQKSAGGGVVMDIAVHMADMLGWYFGKTKKIYALTSAKGKGHTATDNVAALFDFTNGATGVLELSWTLPTGGGLLEVYGDKGTIRMGFTEGNGGIMLSQNGGKYRQRKPGKTKNSYIYFIDGIKGKKNVPNPTDIGRHALACCVAIEKSGETGKPIKPKILNRMG